MIKLWFPSKRVKEPTHKTNSHHNVYPYDRDVMLAQKEGLSLLDFRDRKKMVEEAYTDFRKAGFFVQQKVRPTNDEDFERCGECTIVGACSDYANYGQVRWNDPPLILQVLCEKTGSYLNCSVGWIAKLEATQC